MTKTVRRLIILTSAVTLTAIAEPSDPIRLLTDSQRLATNNESLIFSENSDVISAQSRITTDFFNEYLIENAVNSQVQKLDKISNVKMQNIGCIATSEYNLLCQLVAAEAENQPYTGKMAVVGVVLNRSIYGWPFDEGIEGAIYQDGAFSCVSDGRFFDAWSYISEEDMNAVTQELTDRNYTDILFFQTDHYSKYGTPAYQIGDHFFSTE